MTTNNLKDGLFRLEAKLMTAEQTLASSANSSLDIIERLRKVEDEVKDIQGIWRFIKFNLLTIS
jgi:hypothetical protein